MFVLATTDPQKVPATLRSRTQHLEFRLMSGEILAGLLRDVAEAATLDVPDDALEAAVRRGHGSARDALSALDQVVASGDADDVRPAFDELFAAISDERATDVLASLAVLHAAGWSAPQLADRGVRRAATGIPAAARTRHRRGRRGRTGSALASLGASLGLPRTVRALETIGHAMVEMRDAPDPTVVLEIALVRIARPELDASPAAILERLERLERADRPAPTSSTPPSAPTPLAPPSASSGRRRAPARAPPLRDSRRRQLAPRR